MAGKKPKALGVPPELARIAALRAKLAGTDRDDHLAELDIWETKVKKAAILLSLQGHEGIQILLDHANQELRDIDEVLREGSKPKLLSPEGSMTHTMEQWALFERKELWEWLRSLFTDAKRDIREVGRDLDMQEAEDDIPGY